MKTLAILAGAAALVLAVSTTALAQDKTVYSRKTVIDLSGATIEGELTKPEGSYIVNRKLSKFSTLIQARGDYVPELLTSHNDL